MPSLPLAVPTALIPSGIASSAVDAKAGSGVNAEEQMTQTRDGVDAVSGRGDGGRWGANLSVQHVLLGVTASAIFVAALNHVRVARRRATSIRESLLEQGIASARDGASWGRARPLVMQERPAAAPQLDRRSVLVGLGAAVTAPGLRIGIAIWK